MSTILQGGNSGSDPAFRMASLPAAESDPTQNSNVHFENEFELDDDEVREGQLAPHKNVSESHNDLPREVVTEIDRRRILVHVKCLTPKLVQFDGKKGCMIVLQLIFTPKLEKSRPKRATIEVDFIDHTADVQNPHGSDAAAREQRRYRPRIVAFEPHQFEGRIDRRDAPRTMYAEVSGGFGGVGVGMEVETPSIKEASRRILGTSRGSSGSVLFWVLSENQLTNQGVFPDFTLPIITTYTENRRFGARVRVTVDLGFGSLLYLKCGKMDDPIFFNPEKIREFCPTDVNVEVEDLRKITKLAQYGGRFLD